MVMAQGGMRCNVAHCDNAPIRNAGRASSADPVTLPHNLHRPCSCRASKMSGQLPAKRCMTVSCMSWTAVNIAPQLVLHAEHAFAALLDLLLYAQLVCVSALLLSAVHSPGVQAGIAPALQQRHVNTQRSFYGGQTLQADTSCWTTQDARLQCIHQQGSMQNRAEVDSLPADHLVLVVLPRQDLQGRLNDATTKAHHQVEGGICNKSTLSYAMHTRGLQWACYKKHQPTVQAAQLSPLSTEHSDSVCSSFSCFPA